MKNFLSALLLTVFGLGLALPTYAWNSDRVPDQDQKWHYDLISLRGDDLGNVYVNREGEDIKMDFDFDNDPACTVQSIMVEDVAKEDDFPRLAWGYLDPDRFDFKEGVGFRQGLSYIEPRDAVLYFDRDWSERDDRSMAAAVRFNCHNNDWQLGFVGNKVPREDTAARYFVITGLDTYDDRDSRVEPASYRNDDAWKEVRDNARDWYQEARAELRQEYKQLRQERRERDNEWKRWRKERRDNDDAWRQKKEQVRDWYEEQKDRLDERWEQIKAEYRQRREAWQQMRDEA